MDSFDPSTTETRAEHQAQRASDYPLPDERLAALRASIARRLREADISIPDGTLNALVLDMARVALRWSQEEMDAREGPTRDVALAGGGTAP